MQRKQKFYSVGVFISTILWSLSFIWTKQALDWLTSEMLILARVTIAMTVIWCFSRLTHRLLDLRREDIKYFLLLSLFEPVAYFMCETNALRMVSPTLAVVVVSMIPLLAPVMAHLVNGEHISGRGWMGLIVSFLGMIVVVLSDGGSFSGTLVGVLLLFGAVVSTLVYNLFVQRMIRRYNAYTIVVYENVFALIYLVPLVYLVDFDEILGLTFSWEWVVPVLTLGVLCSGVAFVLYANGIKHLGIAGTSVYINLMPGMTAVAAFFLLGDGLSALKILGIFITVFGLMVASFGINPVYWWRNMRRGIRYRRVRRRRKLAILGGNRF